MNPAPQPFTAAQLAAALGLKRQVVRWYLREVSPAGVCIVGGNEAQTWMLSSLPVSLHNRLDAEARRRGCRGVTALLQSPPVVWPPQDFPALTEIDPAEIQRASQLRQALMPSLLSQHDGESSADFEARGVEDYRKSFGHAISTRHWRSLFKRTLVRDAGAENFARLQLYLPDQPALIQQAARPVPKSIAGQFEELESYLAAIPNPSAPSEMETRGVWTLALEHYGRMVGQGTPAKRAARRVRNFLFARAPFLARTRNALRMAFERKLERWTTSRCDPLALGDGRADNGAQFEFPEDDRDLLIHRSVFYYRGDIAPAWRDCLRKGFSEPFRQRYADKSSDKSHVPQSVMDSIGSEVDILTVMDRGPRAFDSIKGFVSRNYEGIASLQCVQGDDFTLNTYFYIPDGKGWFTLTRGQVILFIDFRTLRILGWALEPRKSYSSLTIRSLCTHIFGEFGVPEVLYFERGLWKSATLLKGQSAPLGFTEISQGLREFGVHFMHAIRPRSKTVERVGGLFQDIAEAEPGYCGRDERRDAPESLRRQMAEVEARKVHPSKYFYSLDEWNMRLGQLVGQFNATPQQGKILAGLSPETAFEKHLDRDDPPMPFGAQLRYLLAHDKRRATVTLNGITIRIGKQPFNYRGQEIAHLVGHEVLAWFDPENPDVLTITDLDRKNPICVRRSNEPSALEVLADPYSGILKRELDRIEGQASYMATRFNVVKARFPLPQRRLLADAQSAAAIELGREIEAGKSRTREAVVRGKRQREQARRFADQTGIVVRDPAQLEDKADDARIVRDFLNAGKESPS